MRKIFDPGKPLMTKGIAKAIRDPYFLRFCRESMVRFLSGDWGDTSSRDREKNALALLTGQEPIVAFYSIPDWASKIHGDIMIITEWDRSYTTICFPSEY